jgi:cell division septation protein DedD
LRSAPKTIPTPASLFSKDSNSLAQKSRFRAATKKSSRIKPALEEAPIPEKLLHSESGYYSLQVGSFQSFREANKMVRMLERAGHKTYLVSVTMPERGGLWYRVRVGPFLSKKDAWTYKKAFEERERIPAFVVKRRVNS